MDKKAVQTLTTEKLFTTLNKYRLHPEICYLKAIDFAGNTLFDDTLKIDLLKLNNFIKELQAVRNI